MSNSLLKKLVAGVSATAITLSIVAPVTSVSAASNAEIEAANRLANDGIIVDNSSNVADYNLDDNITRREMAKIMMNLSGVEVSDTCEGKFADLPAGDWGCKYAEAALAEGYVAANATFGADNNISKWESLKFILKARGIDVTTGENYQQDYVDAAVANDVISESFTDYNTAARRGWIFTSASAAIDATSESDDDIELCEILGTCSDDTTTDDEDDTTVEDDTTTDDEEDDTSSTVTGGVLEVTLSPESPRDDDRVPEATPRVTMMKLEVSAGDEDVELQKITLDATGFGAPEYIDDVVLYNAKGEKITRQRSVSKSNQNAELDFIDDFTVSAGTTQTLTVSAQISSSATNGDVFGLTVSELEASATVEGLPVVGPEVESIELASQGQLKIDSDVATQDIKVGEDSKLGGFKMKVDEDDEDMTLHTIRFKQTGTVDESNIADLYLEVDGETLLENLTFKGEYVTANFGEGYVFDKDKTSYVYFELRGSVSGDPSDTVAFEIEETDDVYATGNKNGYNVPVNGLTSSGFALTTSGGITVEGSEISADFVKGEKDGTNVDADDFDFGTLKLKSNSGNYNLKEYSIMLTVKNTNAGTDLTQDDLPEDIRLGGVSAESDLTLDAASNIRALGANDADTQRYLVEFKDITLSEGEQNNLMLTADISKDAQYGITYEWDLQFYDSQFNIEDEDTDTEYTVISGGTYNAKDILSSYSGFDSRKIEVESPTLKFENINIDSEDVVLGDTTTKVYKGTVEAGSSADIRLRQMTFSNVATNPVDNLENVIQNATLRIGSVETKTTDISTSGGVGYIKFNDLDQIIKSGSTNKETVELIVQFKKADDSDIDNGDDEVKLALNDVEAEDYEVGSSLAASALTFDDTDASNTITLATEGSLEIKIDTVQNSDSEKKDMTDKARFLLGGTESAILARIEMDAEKEAINVKDLTINSATFTSGAVDSYTQATNFKNSFENVRLVKEDKSTVVGNVGNFEVVDPNDDGANGDDDEYVKAYLEDMDLTVDIEDKEVYFLIADVQKVDLDTDAASATAGTSTTFVLDSTADTYDIEGEDSGNDLVTGGGGLTLGANVSKSITVLASYIADINIDKISNTPAVGDFVDIAEISFTLPTSTVNVDADSYTIKPALKKLSFSSSDISVSGITNAASKKYTLQLRESDSGETVTLQPGEFVFDNLNTLFGDEAAEIDNTVEFVLSLKVNDSGSTDVDAASTVSIRLDREDMQFVDGSDVASTSALAASAEDIANMDIVADAVGVAGNDLTLTIAKGADINSTSNDQSFGAKATITVNKVGNDITVTFANVVTSGANTDTVTVKVADIIDALNSNEGVFAARNITFTETVDVSGDIDATINPNRDSSDAAFAATVTSLTGGRDAGNDDTIGGVVFNKVYADGAEVNAD